MNPSNPLNMPVPLAKRPTGILIERFSQPMGGGWERVVYDHADGRQFQCLRKGMIEERWAELPEDRPPDLE
jgi:hypothetical protein